jgi:hypothetical protein
LGDRSTTNNINVVNIVIVIKGKKTINHEIIPNPFLQSKFNKIVKIIITTNFKKAILYIFLNISIMICVNEKTIYNIAGIHKLSNNILF